MSLPPPRQTGMTLIELIIFIVIVSVGVAGILTVLNITVWHSSDPLVQKQAQALAEGLLEEIQTGYFAYCDPQDAQLKYAKSAAACTGGVGDSYRPVQPCVEGRPCDSVIHYASAANTATDLPLPLPGESVTVPTGNYSASVTIRPTDLGNIIAVSGDALLIRVTVTGPGSTQAIAEGFKTRQVPQ